MLGVDDDATRDAGPEGRPPRAEPDFRRVFESAPGPIMLMSPDLEILAVSDAFVTVSLVARDALIGRQLFDAFPDNPDSGDSGSRNLRASLERVRRHLVPDVMPVQRYDVQRPAAAGGGFEERYWTPVNAPILGADGELLYIVQRVEDVTGVIRAASGLEGASVMTRDGDTAPSDFEIIARTREVAEASRQLKEANLELERLADELAEAGRAADRQHVAQLAAEREIRRLKEEFLATVSHELRTPLTSVLGYLSLVLDGDDALDPEVAGHLEVARRNGQRLEALVADLLLIAQAQAGRLPLTRRPVDLAPLVAHAVEAARLAADAAGLRLEHAPASVPAVDVDPIRIAQLLDNLISNAVKFTPAGGVVRAGLTAGAASVRVTVADTGPGIPADERPRLFDRFYRTTSAVETGVTGTGLGLAIAKAIAEAHGGTIGLRDEPGPGSTFFVDLPLAPAGDGLLRSASGQ